MMIARIRYILSIFILGALLVVAGAFIKLMHWPYGTTSITAGLILQGVAGIMVIIRLLAERNEK
ncbi:gliding motility protein GldL [Flavobacterium sp.]|uniref:GldL-related protein n=1 Tax=Flavobacterium sp. TaxID=239 RepID=UPI002615603A|nr:gliding motility protein GldL [Flavobacterium sp.]